MARAQTEKNGGFSGGVNYVKRIFTMGLIFGMIKRLLKLAIYTVLFITVVTLIPNLPPYSKFSSIELEPTLPRVGKLQPNEALNNAQKLYENKLKGPEGFGLYNGEVYTGTATGEILKLSAGGKVSHVAQLGLCEAHGDPAKCGHPLGLAVDETAGQLYVADAYLGIWKVDLKSGKKQQLVSPLKEIEGRAPSFFNSLALAKNGDFYWTDSTEFSLSSGFKPLLADPSGRLIHYNAATKQNKVVLDNLWLANGVVVSPDNQFVVVAEFNAFRLQKYYISGPKKGQSELFLGGLPDRAIYQSGLKMHRGVMSNHSPACVCANQTMAWYELLIEFIELLTDHVHLDIEIGMAPPGPY
ncbi:strictosidine synthase domain-containing protein [Phthorimaea operculella]|nr:strictosidine synthase domain-containing protein [Phthorimaea operculella]